MNEKMGMIGRKLGMTQFFQADGNVVPCTVVQLGPNTVLQVKSTTSKDRYNAIQLGFAPARAKLINKPLAGHLTKAGASLLRHVREIRVDAGTVATMSAGKVLTVGEVFQGGQKVDVVGTSKGRGFAGVMKRHHFAGFERTRGAHEYFRHGGSIGTRLTPGMTLKGKKMPGHLGASRTTVQNMTVVRIDAERNLLFIRGGVPGPVGGLVVIRHAVRTPKGKKKK
jgi:large subunit ribosomal protein L3